MDKKTDSGVVSFTDTNAETGAMGKGATSSAMMDLVGTLKQQEVEGKMDKRSERTEKGHKKKKGKKGKKDKKGGKTKIVRGSDKYESQNYLFRIEGTICCGLLVMVVIFLFLNFIVLIAVMIASKMDINHIFNVEEIKQEDKAKEGD